MPRKMVVQLADGSSPLLTEETADEAQLQELVKRLPDLIPIEEFDMAGPMIVVGRETTLPSGSVDLVGLTPAGEILVIEFKTGPQNPDFRHALSQLLDYGSDLWSMSYEHLRTTFLSGTSPPTSVMTRASRVKLHWLRRWPKSGRMVLLKGIPSS